MNVRLNDKHFRFEYYQLLEKEKEQQLKEKKLEQQKEQEKNFTFMPQLNKNS